MKSFTIDEGEVEKKVYSHTLACALSHMPGTQKIQTKFSQLLGNLSNHKPRLSQSECVSQCTYLEFSSSWALTVSFRLCTHREKSVVALKRFQPTVGKETQFTAVHAAVRCLVYKRDILIHLCPRKQYPNNSHIKTRSILFRTGKQGCKGHFLRSDNSLLKDRILLHATEDRIKAILWESSKSSIIGHITFCITINRFRKVTGKKADLFEEVNKYSLKIQGNNKMLWVIFSVLSQRCKKSHLKKYSYKRPPLIGRFSQRNKTSVVKKQLSQICRVKKNIHFIFKSCLNNKILLQEMSRE